MKDEVQPGESLVVNACFDNSFLELMLFALKYVGDCYVEAAFPASLCGVLSLLQSISRKQNIRTTEVLIFFSVITIFKKKKDFIALFIYLYGFLYIFL